MLNHLSADQLFGPELSNPTGMFAIERWEQLHIRNDRPSLLVGAKERAKLELEMVPPGWFVYFDGSMRSNSGSASELQDPPTDKHTKWMIIREYRCILANRLSASCGELYNELSQR